MNYNVFKKYLNRGLWIIAALGLITTLIMFLMPKTLTYPVPKTDITMLEDGTYHEDLENGLIRVEVEVYVSEHKIEAIKLLSSTNIHIEQANHIFTKIIEKQSLDVSREFAWNQEVSSLVQAVDLALKNLEVQP